MTTCLLVRHAVHDTVDRVLVGRTDGAALSSAGRQQAIDLRTRLQNYNFSQIQSSPRQRALETADLVSNKIGADIEICEALDEMDFGLWTGRTFDSLSRDPDWVLWNAERSKVRPPRGGESMSEAQDRIVTHLQRTSEMLPESCVVMVTHAEIIRAAVLYAMSLQLDAWPRINVPPASITRLQVTPHSSRVADRSQGLAVI